MLPERERSHVTPTPVSSATHACPGTPVYPGGETLSGFCSFHPPPPSSLLSCFPSTLCPLPVGKGEKHIWNLLGVPNHGNTLFSSSSAPQRDLTPAGPAGQDSPRLGVWSEFWLRPVLPIKAESGGEPAQTSPAPHPDRTEHLEATARSNPGTQMTAEALVKPDSPLDPPSPSTSTLASFHLLACVFFSPRQVLRPC